MSIVFITIYNNCLYLIANDRGTDTSSSFTWFIHMNEQFSLNIGLQTTARASTTMQSNEMSA